MSVIVNNISGCRHGNQLCQYMVGRIISEKLRFKLFGIENNHPEYCLNGFDVVYNQPTYSSYNTPTQYVGNERNNSHPDCDLEDIINDNTPRRIILEGYFQRKKFFIPYKNNIRQWYNFSKVDVPKDHAVVHVRLGDIRQAHNHPDLLPIEYYNTALEMLNFNKLTICTDSPNDSYISSLIKKYNAEIYNDNEKNTICFIASHDKIVMSVGTFSFWGAFLSDASQIINAIPQRGNNMLSPDNGVDMLIREPNYTYITL
jgi:hypothetical protein